MVVVDGEAGEAQWGKLSGRGDAISAAKEGRRTGKEGGRPKQAAHQVSTGRKAQAAPSFPRVCRTKSNKQDGAQAGVAVRSSAEGKEERGEGGFFCLHAPKVFLRHSTLTGGKFKWHFQG